MPSLEIRSRSQWPKNGMTHSSILRGIHTPNMGFLPQRKYREILANTFYNPGIFILNIGPDKKILFA